MYEVSVTSYFSFFIYFVNINVFLNAEPNFLEERYTYLETYLICEIRTTFEINEKTHCKTKHVVSTYQSQLTEVVVLHPIQYFYAL